jgi:hypothetical protein
LSGATFCGICEPEKLRSGLCDYHAKTIMDIARTSGISVREATAKLYSEAVEEYDK